MTDDEQRDGDDRDERPARRRVDVIAYLHAAATLACVETGLKYRIDRSDRSEAFYVKVFRQDDAGGHWRGTRVACHLPVYRCSQDYAQVHVPRFATDPAELADARRELERHVREGGVVVADPDEVREAMFTAFREARDGAEVAGPAGTRWRWREKTLRWKLLSVDGVPAKEVPADLRRLAARFAPPDAPDVRLHPRVQSDVRHRLNRRARWEWEEECDTRR